MKYIFNKCLLIIYGIFIAIGLLELGLRIGGYVYLEKNDPPDIKKNAYRILCLGDSFTYGVGAPRDQSYPSQLLALLKIKREDTPVSVINYGYGGQNTSQLLYRLSSDIERLDPHLIILLTGLNNRWNYWGLSDYLKVATVWERVEKHLYCSRVYKLLVVLYHRFNQKMFIGKSKQRENTIKMLEYDSDDEYKIEKYDYDLFKDYR